MIVFPNCKINLGLSIINKRNDGYHNLETVFYPLGVKDILEIIPDIKSEFTTTDQVPGHVTFTTSGVAVDGNSMDNLCVKAYCLLQKDFPSLPSVKMHLHKAIPMGAGSFTLKLLNTQFKLNLSFDQLIQYAVDLGSDCPFFILNNPCFATGRGEKMEPIAIDLSAYLFVLINPGISINTGWAFSQLDINSNNAEDRVESLKETIVRSVSDWKNFMTNDFEKPVFEKYPEIKLIKRTLYEQGALYASMTGSGSTVYGIFRKDAMPVFNFPSGYRIIKVNA